MISLYPLSILLVMATGTADYSHSHDYCGIDPFVFMTRLLADYSSQVTLFMRPDRVRLFSHFEVHIADGEAVQMDTNEIYTKHVTT